MDTSQLERDRVESAPELAPEPDPETRQQAMQDYYKLKYELYVIVFAVLAVSFISVWVVYSLNIALNYLLGATVGLIYLRMLARDVEQLGQGRRKLSKTRLVPFIAVIVLATRVDSLEILPIFLGFLTYKVGLILYALRAIVNPNT
ncbi:MAG: ATP synthase subunit I [Cyanobacteria bacterium]|jgi:ATP synthase protein I|nr:ATP synthase subunit I [Cyanobacteriota bacterium]